MSQSSQRSVVGGLGDQILGRVVVSESPIKADVRDVLIEERVKYTNGRWGPTRTTSLDMYERWDDSNVKDVRFVGVDPRVLLRVYVPALSESVLVRMEPRDVVEFGEFSSVEGRFTLTTETVDLTLDADSVSIAGVGSFERADDVSSRDTSTYDEFCQRRQPVADKSDRCGILVEHWMREAWAKREGMYSNVWRVDEVTDDEHSDSASVEVPAQGVPGRVEFSFSLDDWEKNDSLRKFVKQDGDGLVSNLEGERVVVSLGEFSWADPVAATDIWYLYRYADRPSLVNRVKDVFA